MKRFLSFVSAVMFAALCCTFDIFADAAQPSVSGTPAVTQPNSREDADPQELYGLSADTSEFTLTVGENRALEVSLNTDYYLADSLRFYSDDESVAWVYPYFGGHVIGISAGTATIQVSAKLDKNKVTLAPDDYGYRSVTVKVTVTEPVLSETQKAALKKLAEAEQYGRYIYLRERAVITGVLAADAPRLTLDELNRIVDPSQPYEKVWKELMDAQVYPDTYDTGDPTQLGYWLDERGLEAVGIMDCAMIHYSRADENGVPQEVRCLYPEPQGPFVPADVPVRDAYTPYNAPYSPETRPELYGLTLDLSSDTLYTGEVCQLLASWAGDCYLEHPVIQSDNNDIALVYDDGIRTVTKTITVTDSIPAPGDANCDGRTDVSDAVLIARFAVADQEAVITDRGKLNADVTGDGNITADDASRILLFIAKKISYEELGG